MTLYHPRPERWPQVSLRGLLVAVALVAAPLAWLGAQVKWIHDRHEARQWIRSRHGSEYPDGVKVPNNAYRVVSPAPWPIRIFGERGVWIIIVLPGKMPPEEFANRVEFLRRLFPEAKVHTSIGKGTIPGV